MKPTKLKPFVNSSVNGIKIELHRPKRARSLRGFRSTSGRRNWELKVDGRHYTISGYAGAGNFQVFIGSITEEEITANKPIPLKEFHTLKKAMEFCVTDHV